jgi:hypothetical protein
LYIAKDSSTSTTGNTVGFFQAANCWVKNVYTYRGGHRHYNVSLSRDITITHSKLEKNRYTESGGTNNSSAMTIVRGTTDSLFVNNIILDVEGTVKFEAASVGNVWAYNYARDLVNWHRDMWLHGSWPSEILFEGNVGNNTSMYSDAWWGKEGPRNTWFRNRILGGSFSSIRLNPDRSGGLGGWYNFLLNVSESVIGGGGGSLANHNRPDGTKIHDAETTNLWAEKNRFTDLFVRGTESGQVSTTTYVDESSVCSYTDHQGTQTDCAGYVGPYVKTNQPSNSDRHATDYSDPTLPPDEWSGFDAPASLFLNSKPDWWCKELPWPAIGADIDDLDNLQKTPAQRRDEGMACTVSAPPLPPDIDS